MQNTQNEKWSFAPINYRCSKTYFAVILIRSLRISMAVVTINCVIRGSWIEHYTTTQNAPPPREKITHTQKQQTEMAPLMLGQAETYRACVVKDIRRPKWRNLGVPCNWRCVPLRSVHDCMNNKNVVSSNKIAIIHCTAQEFSHLCFLVTLHDLHYTFN